MDEKALSEIDSIVKSGAVFIVKIDGARWLSSDKNIYTVILSGGALDRDSFFRCDGDDLSLLIESALDFYRSHEKKRQG